MTQEELKEKIAKTKKAISSEPEGSEDRKLMEDFLKKLESKIETQPEKPKKVIKKKVVKKPVAATKQKKPKTKIVKKALETQVQPKEVKPKEVKVKVEKGKKAETHIINTSFGKEIEGAILTLNKARFVIREKKDKKTGKKTEVKHSKEYRNAETIQKRVNVIFSSSIYDIAKSNKEKQEKKEVIAEAEAIRDLTTLWLNEVDILINNEDVSDLAAIKKMMIGLIREARKNDPEDKYQLNGGLKKLVEKYKI